MDDSWAVSDNDDKMANSIDVDNDDGDDEANEQGTNADEEDSFSFPQSPVTRSQVQNKNNAITKQSNNSCTRAHTPPVPKARHRVPARNLQNTATPNNINQQAHQLQQCFRNAASPQLFGQQQNGTEENYKTSTITTMHQKTIANTSTPRHHNGVCTIFERKTQWQKIVCQFHNHCDSLLSHKKYLTLFLLNSIILAYLIYILNQLQFDLKNLKQEIQVSSGQQLNLDPLDLKLKELNINLIDRLEWKINSDLERQTNSLKKFVSNELQDLYEKLNAKSNEDSATIGRNAQGSTGNAAAAASDKGILSFWPFSSSEQQTQDDGLENSDDINNKKLQDLRQQLELLSENQFQAQPRPSWLHIYSPIASTLEASPQNTLSIAPERPAVIFMMQKSSEAAINFGTCFVKTLATTINKIVMRSTNYNNNNIKYIDPEYFNHFGTQSEIQEDITHHLQNSGKTIVVNDVNKIQNYADLLVFHSFCDNYAAPDPKAIFIFLVTIDSEFEHEIVTSWDDSSSGRIAYEFLNKAWKNVLSEDKIFALISRVAQSVVLIQRQNDGISYYNCD